MKATSDSIGCWIAITSTRPISENKSRMKDVTSMSTTLRAALALCVMRMIRSADE